MTTSISGYNERWPRFDPGQPSLGTLSGPNPVWAATPATTASAGAPGNAAAPPGLSGALSDGMSLTLMALDHGAPTPQPGGVRPPPAEPPPWSNDISNTGTAAGGQGTHGRPPAYSDSVPQQFALSAYTRSDPDTSAASPSANVTA